MVTESKAEEGSYLPFLAIFLPFLAINGQFCSFSRVSQMVTAVTDGPRWSQLVTVGHRIGEGWVRPLIQPPERLAVLSRTELACIVYCTNSPNQQRRSTNNFQRSARYHDGIRLLWRDTMMVSAYKCGSPGVGIAVGRGRKLGCGWIWDTIWETPAIRIFPGHLLGVFLTLL